MADPIYWDDAYPIALMLRIAHPHVSPAELALSQVHAWVIVLDGFADEPVLFDASILEQIVVEWVELEN